MIWLQQEAHNNTANLNQIWICELITEAVCVTCHEVSDENTSVSYKTPLSMSVLHLCKML